ncbi:MAG: PIG-L family deacetylase, partial [Planctomycetes bacterium]|nr:PIG-L family deacetylase [Planctomycetota bacterium]
HPTDRPFNVLCLGAHADDIEIGCGGTLLRLLADRDAVQVSWVVFSAASRCREQEARRSAEAFLAGAASYHLRIGGLRDGFFPAQRAELKEQFEQLKQQFEPDVILCHRRDDAHQDHALVGEATWNTFRHHLILEYEIPKYDGDLGRPNVFVQLGEATCRQKSDLLLTFFQSQLDRHWFSADTFMGLLRLRGVECASPTRYAEGFHCRKIVV